MLRRMWFYPLMLCMVLMLSASVMAQAQGGGGAGAGGGGFAGPGGAGGPGGGGRGGRGGGGVEAQLEQIHVALAATDEEWTVLQPKVSAVLAAQQEANSGRGGRGGGGGRGGRGGGGPNGAAQTPESAVARAMQALRDALANAASNNDLINQRMLALREARARADASLVTAQKTLKELLTPRQEATMVTLGYLP